MLSPPPPPPPPPPLLIGLIFPCTIDPRFSGPRLSGPSIIQVTKIWVYRCALNRTAFFIYQSPFTNYYFTYPVLIGLAFPRFCPKGPDNVYHFVKKSSQYCMHGIPLLVVLFVFIQELHQSSHTGCTCTDEILQLSTG